MHSSPPWNQGLVPLRFPRATLLWGKERDEGIKGSLVLAPEVQPVRLRSGQNWRQLLLQASGGIDWEGLKGVQGQEVAGTSWEGGTLGQQEGKGGLKRQHGLNSLQDLGDFCKDQKQESKLGAAHSVSQSGTGSEVQEQPVCPPAVWYSGIAFSGQTGNLGPCPGPTAS